MRPIWRRARIKPRFGRASLWAHLAKCLDLRDTWTDSSSGKDFIQSDVLNPIKSTCCFTTIFFHISLFLSTISDWPLEIDADMERTVASYALLLSSSMTDTLFLISGLLMTYIMLKKLSQRKKP